MAKKKPKQCAYCGRITHDWDWDHPVPQCLWGDRDLPPNVITVPCCVRCNLYWSLHDGFFRTVVAIKSRRANNAVCKEILKTKVASYFKKDAKFSREWYGSQKLVPQFNSNGLYVGETNQNSFNPHRLFLTIGKIVRGIFYHHTKRPLPLDHAVAVWRNQNFCSIPTFATLLQTFDDDFSSFGGDDKVFLAQLNYNDEMPNSLMAHLIFYEGISFLACTIPGARPIAEDLSHPMNVARHIGVRDRRKQWRKANPFT